MKNNKVSSSIKTEERLNQSNDVRSIASFCVSTQLEQDDACIEAMPSTQDEHTMNQEAADFCQPEEEKEKRSREKERTKGTALLRKGTPKKIMSLK